MENSEFPPNSEVSKRGKKEEKNVESVVSGEVTRKRRSLRKQFSETFVAGDLKSALQYVVMDVLLSAARDTAVEVVQSGMEKLIYGESRRHRGSTQPQSGPYGNIAYNRAYSPGLSRLPGPQRALSRQARSRHNFDEIVLEQRTDAEEVIDRLFDLVSRYDTATVADLYELVGLASNFTDHKWGWTNLAGAGVTRTRGGYLLDLPDPEPLD